MLKSISTQIEGKYERRNITESWMTMQIKQKKKEAAAKAEKK